MGTEYESIGKIDVSQINISESKERISHIHQPLQRAETLKFYLLSP